MVHLIESIRVIDRYLLQHFVFESSDCIQFNGFHGNFALNKYMSLHDWQEIYSCLQNDIASYIENERIQRKPNEFILSSMNIRLAINWTELDKEFYQKIIPNSNTSAVFPFVMHISISTISNIAEFKRTEMIASNDVSAILESCNEVSDLLPPIKKCCVLIPKLKVNNVPHKKSMSSTPLERHQSNAVIPIGNDVSGISSEQDADQSQCSSQGDTQNRKPSMRKRLFARLINDTPQNRKIRSIRKKREIRPSPKVFDHREKGRAIRQIYDKKPTAVRKLKVTSKQKDKKTPRVKRVKACAVNSEKSPKKNTVEISVNENAAEKTNDWELEAVAIDDVLVTFGGCSSHLTQLFYDYLKQTDETVKKSGDYNPMDIMKMITHDQFGAMADLLYENFTAVGDINCGTLFLELLLPEWILAVFMDKLALNRADAIEHINKRSQSKEEPLHLSSIIKLDDSSRLETLSTNQINISLLQ